MGRAGVPVGDRIMQTRNDYDVVWEKADGTVGTGMFNGDVGRIAEIDAGGEWLALDFDGLESALQRGNAQRDRPGRCPDGP